MASIPMPFIGAVPLLSPADTATVTRAFARSGLLRFYRPDHLLGLAREAKAYGLGPGMGPGLPSRTDPDAIGFVDGGTRLTFAELQQLCEEVADRLAAVGLVPGSRLGLLAWNGLGFYTTVVGASRAGLDVGYLNTGFTRDQVADVCEQERIDVVAVSPGLLDRVPPGIPVLHLADTGPVPTGVLSASDERARRGAHRSRHIILTSGTTGRPKGAARTGGGLDAIVAMVTGLGLRTHQRHLVAAPMFHAWGWSHLLFTMLLSSTVVTLPRFDAERVLATIEAEQCEVLVAVPAMLQRILELPPEARGGYDTTCLHTVAVSGSALPARLATEFMDEFGDVVFNLFGSTEAAFATVANPSDLRQAPGTAGRPLPGVRVRVVDEHGKDAPTGVAGSIVVGSATSFEGYTSGEDKPRVGGLVAMGDRGWFDAQGRLFVASREDDMVVTGGENVYPVTVEDAVRTHPDVRDVAVVGVPDERFGQVLVAHVVVRAGVELTSDELLEWTGERLAPFQRPRRVVLHDELPRNETGKVLARVLREHETDLPGQPDEA